MTDFSMPIFKKHPQPIIIKKQDITHEIITNVVDGKQVITHTETRPGSTMVTKYSKPTITTETIVRSLNSNMIARVHDQKQGCSACGKRAK